MKHIVTFAIAAGLSSGLAPAQTVVTVCSSGCNYGLNQIQQAVDDSQPGWIIEIAAGQTAVTVAGLILRNKGIVEGPYITIRSSAMNELAPGKRVTPADKPKLGTISYTLAQTLAIYTDAGAGFYRFEGIEVVPPAGGAPFNLIQLGGIVNGSVSDNEVSKLPHDIVFDRCYIHGLPNISGPIRGILVNTGKVEITNSWISDMKSRFNESQAVAGWNTTGPFFFRNNFMSGSSITTLFGGAPPLIRGARATGVFFQGNHYYRPWTWRSVVGTTNPNGACLWDANGGEYYSNTANSTYWQCNLGVWTAISQLDWDAGFLNKNQFEFKNTAQAIVEGNRLENSWLPAFQGQHGAAILINQVDNFFTDFGEPTATVMNTTFRYNVALNTPWGISMGRLGEYTIPVHDVVFENNLFYKMGQEPQSLGDVVMLQTTGTGSVRYSHNTTIVKRQTGGRPVSLDGGPTDMVSYYGNIVGFNQGGFQNTFSGTGNLWNAVDSAWNQNRMFSRNVVVNDQNLTIFGDPHPKVNIDRKADTGRTNCMGCAYPAAWADVQFEDFAGDDYRLRAGSPYKKWSHWGLDAGADLDSVTWATKNAVDGAYNPFFDFLIRDLRPAQTALEMRYTAYDQQTCRLTVSDRFDYLNPVYDAPDAGGDQDRPVTVTGLTANKRYFYSLACGVEGYRRTGVFLTLP